ncbi:hypothetical protein BXY70_1322 [Roseovarius halotolerans]|uniref:Uncharacterized protein n=1 Tax=Roseovarius halotolerans TaxID=505353 RepID=A0A1X6Y5W8_9RHOB|nr:hypothetical protein [Roseovarius halotolerans]RKT35289.1 hypothetical protein BXY70_1322 [Roseovarius halotolerans]SLN11207.1 hypothetical protein ROH8110_00074 [Roseovarius halotolerans]
MKLSEAVKIAPSSVPVATIPWRDQLLDVFAPTGADLCWLLSKSQAFGDALESAADSRISSLLAAVSESGPEILEKLLTIATGEDVDTVRTAHFSLEEQVDILTALFENGVPEVLRGKLLAVVADWLETAAETLDEAGESSEPG